MKLRIEHLSKSYGNFNALDDVSFQCESGQFFSILGKSGSGKTTLIRLIAGLEEPTSGKVFLENQDITKTPTHKRGIVMVFQNYALFPHLNVFENVAFGLRERGMKKAEMMHIVVEKLKSLDMESKMYREISELSGGEQQRVAIARALAVDSKVILFDEPLSNLDAVLRREMQKELKSIQRKTKQTFIYITHDQEEALMLSDQLIILEKGKLRESGSPKIIYESPKTLYGAKFLGSANTMSVERLDKKLLKTQTGLVFQTSDEYNERFYDVAIRPEHLEPVQAQGENVFMAKVLERYFKGSFYEYVINVEGMIMTMISNHELGNESLVHVKKFFIFSKE